MNMLNLLKSEAVKRHLIDPDKEIDAESAFTLVRDMLYQRASDRRPETIIREWRGTCSGKHYLLHQLFDELGIASQIIACTSVTPVDPHQVAPDMQQLYEAANRRFVDVHNYLLVTLPDGGQMVVDATWPLSAREHGMVVNEEFIMGKDQKIATTPEKNWAVPIDQDAQAFKDQLLKEHFSPAELQFREVVIEAISKQTAEAV